jgi:hypothetical protein
MTAKTKHKRGQNPASMANLKRDGRQSSGRITVPARLLPEQVEGLDDLVSDGAAVDRGALLRELTQIALDFAIGRDPANLLDDMRELLFEEIE